MVSYNPIDWKAFVNTEDKLKIQQSPEYREWLIGMLSEGDHGVEITFTKKDGTLRKMKCTRSAKLIPEDQQPKNSDDKTVGAIPVYDLESSGWRSFLPENLTLIDYPNE
jgi:hypothetical protein